MTTEVTRELRRVEVERGVSLALDVYDGGRAGARPVLLLHGFPQCAYVWRHVGPALAERGFRALAPDLRGYDRSDKPEKVKDYREPRLVDDVVALCDALGHGRVSVVAHDWGAVVAWRLAATHPELVEKLVILNGPHPDRYREVLFKERDFDQLRRSWYVYFFQLPWLAEAALTSKGALERLFRRSSAHPESFEPDEIAYYEAAIAKPGAARGMLSWYRATARYPPPALPKIGCDTLVLWGCKDEALSPKMSEGLERFVDGPLRVVRYDDASHWLVEEKRDDVVREVVAFLG